MKDPAALLHAYLASEYALPAPGERLEVRIGTRFSLAPCADGTPFALITAYDPRSVRASRADNERADAQLHRALVDAGAGSCLRSLARASDGSHEEPGWLCTGVALAECDALALRFGQNAIVAGALGSEARLRCYARSLGLPFPPRGVDMRFIDWIP